MSDLVIPAGFAPVPRRDTPFRSLVSEFVASPAAVVGLVLLCLIAAAAVLAPVISLHNPYDLRVISITDSLIPPGGAGVDGRRFWLGTDDQGRDMWSAILYGLRTSLSVGVASGVIAFAIGVSLGLWAAYAGGAVEAAIMRVVDLNLGVPSIMIGLVIVAAFGRGVDRIILALVIIQWALYARAARATALVELNKEYVEACRCLALSHARILFRHILPNCLPTLMVIAAIEVAHAIVIESTLSFLGVGLPITAPSLGLLTANGYNYMLSGKFWISFFPGLALMLTVLSINLVADRMLHLLNPRMQR